MVPPRVLYVGVLYVGALHAGRVLCGGLLIVDHQACKPNPGEEVVVWLAGQLTQNLGAGRHPCQLLGRLRGLSGG